MDPGSGYSGGAGAMDSSENDVSEANGYSEREVRDAGNSEASNGNSNDSGGVVGAIDSVLDFFFGGSKK